MTKTSLIFLLTIILMTACATTAPQTAPVPAPEIQNEPLLQEPTSVSIESSTAELNPPESVSPGTVSTVFAPGLRIIYLRGGNLWSWTEADGNAQLTNTGDMSAINVSEDGHLLAFMRFQEVWTVRMDGTDARKVGELPASGGHLRLAPNGQLLLVSTNSHIDMFDLNTTSKNTVITYPIIPNGYAPEVVWMSDSSGFKTVIPAPVDGGLAEMMFVFPDGTVASLAKFAMVSPVESYSYFSPDSGYVIYVAKSDDGKDSLFLMDSSGATKPYGEPAEHVRAYGWLPDSQRFVYGEVDKQRTLLGDVGGSPMEVNYSISAPVQWVDDDKYITLQGGGLYIGDMSGASRSIDSDVTDFDVVTMN